MMAMRTSPRMKVALLCLRWGLHCMKQHSEQVTCLVTTQNGTSRPTLNGGVKRPACQWIIIRLFQTFVRTDRPDADCFDLVHLS